MIAELRPLSSAALLSAIRSIKHPRSDLSDRGCFVFGLTLTLRFAGEMVDMPRP